jgi:Tfp pilus assembly protein PilZ/GAF domain-containing protein
VSVRELFKKLSRGEAIKEAIDKEIPGKMKDIERLEKQDRQLWLITIFLILILTLFIVVNYFEELRGSPREFFKHITFLSTYILVSAILILVFCVYTLKKNRELRRLRREIFAQRTKLQHMAGTLEDVTAFFQISSMISTHKALPTILEHIAGESLNCLKAHRSTIFLMEGKSGILKAQFTCVPNPEDQQVSLYEEKEVARKTLKQGCPLLLGEAKDFSDFFKYEGRERKITSLLSMPISSRGKPSGVLSVVLINGDRCFDENDLQFLSIFGNYASIALDNESLQEEVRKGISFRKRYQGYLDEILNQLPSISEEERRRIEDHLDSLIPALEPSEKQGVEPPIGKKVALLNGDVAAVPEVSMPMGTEERGDRMLKVEFQDSSLGFADDLIPGGVFISTPNPMDLGEQFLLKLHMSDGGEPIEVACKVIWTNKYGKDSQHLRRGMGVKFLNIADDLQKRVEEFIRGQRKREPSMKDWKASAGEVEGERRKTKGAA